MPRIPPRARGVPSRSRHPGAWGHLWLAASVGQIGAFLGYEGGGGCRSPAQLRATATGHAVAAASLWCPVHPPGPWGPAAQPASETEVELIPASGNEGLCETGVIVLFAWAPYTKCDFTIQTFRHS